MTDTPEPPPQQQEEIILNHGDMLLAELRELIAPADDRKPVAMIGLPRWAALMLCRARARELGTRLREAFSNSIRERTKMANKDPMTILWLSSGTHPHGGCFVACHLAYYGNPMILTWRNAKPVLWPRSWGECQDLPMVAWRSDQELWGGNEASVRANMSELKRAIAKQSRAQSGIHPSPTLSAMIAEYEQRKQAL